MNVSVLGSVSPHHVLCLGHVRQHPQHTSIRPKGSPLSGQAPGWPRSIPYILLPSISEWKLRVLPSSSAGLVEGLASAQGLSGLLALLLFGSAFRAPG